MIEIVDARSAHCLRAFLALPKRLHRAEPHALPAQLEPLERSLRGGRNALLASGEHLCLLAREGNVPLMRVLTGCVDGQGYIALFEGENRQDAFDALMQRVLRAQREWGAKRLFGPVPIEPWDVGKGIQTQGFERPAALWMSRNPPYYEALFLRGGFRQTVTHFSYELCLKGEQEARWSALEARLRARFSLDIRPMAPDRAASCALYEIMREEQSALRMEDAEAFVHAARRRWERQFALVAFDETRPVGMLLGFPDGRERLRAMTLWVKKGYRGGGAAALLLMRLLLVSGVAGIQAVEAGTIDARNAASRTLAERMGGRICRAFAQFECDLIG